MQGREFVMENATLKDLEVEAGHEMGFSLERRPQISTFVKMLQVKSSMCKSRGMSFHESCLLC